MHKQTQFKDTQQGLSEVETLSIFTGLNQKIFLLPNSKNYSSDVTTKTSLSTIMKSTL